MQNNDNQKTYFIYVRSTGEKVPVTKEQHDSFYKEADRIRHKEQDHGRCMCPYRFIWKCDGDCIGCEYHAAGDITSLDQPLPDGNGTLGYCPMLFIHDDLPFIRIFQSRPFQNDTRQRVIR